MATYKVFKETALPGTLAAHSIYLVAPAAHPGYLEIYVTDAAGTATRRTHKVEDIQAMIDSSLAGMSGGATIVDNIAARNALTPSNGLTVLVVDASADPTVDTGAATYVYRESNTSWVKISEYESLDISLSWANITGKPTSAVADIDDAVSKRHTHANKTQLDKISEDGNGELTYNGNNVAPRLTSSGW
jgi:hypothetical protein